MLGGKINFEFSESFWINLSLSTICMVPYVKTTQKDKVKINILEYLQFCNLLNHHSQQLQPPVFLVLPLNFVQCSRHYDEIPMSQPLKTLPQQDVLPSRQYCADDECCSLEHSAPYTPLHSFVWVLLSCNAKKNTGFECVCECVCMPMCL